jgi:hypothetical protein
MSKPAAVAGDIRDHDVEPLVGLPECLPVGERLLWQGSPDARAMLRRVLHADLVVLWFLLIGCWRLGSHWLQTGEVALATLAGPVLALTLALSMLFLLAWGYAKTTVYTLTNRRVTMRFGIAVQITMNIPFSKITSADVSEHGNDIGNIAFQVEPGARMSHLILWPNVRPWYWLSPRPMLCCVGGLGKAGAILTAAVREYSTQTHQHQQSQRLHEAHMQEA